MAEALSDAIAGTAGTVVGNFFTYPLDFLKVRVQVSGAGISQGDIVHQVYSSAGIFGFYAGCGAKVLKSSIQKFIMFFLQRVLGSSYRAAYMQGRPANARIDTVPYMIISWLGELLGLPIIIPIETVVTRLQTSTGGESVMDHVRDIRNAPGGVGALFNSFPAYVFTCMQPGIQFPIFEILKSWRLQVQRQRIVNLQTDTDSSEELSMGWIESFFVGAVSKALAQITTFPFERTRSKFQSLQKSGQVTSVFSIMRSLYKEEGLGFPLFGTGMWKGVYADLYQGVLNAALMMMIKEQLQRTVKNVVLATIRT